MTRENDRSRQSLTAELKALRRRVAELERSTGVVQAALPDEPYAAADDSYRQIFDGVNDMILVHDPQTGEILDVNGKALEYGLNLEAIRRMGVAGFSPKGEQYSPGRIRSLLEQAAGGEPQVFEWGFLDPEGKLHPTEVNLKSATIGGRDVLLAIVRDISERKSREQALRRATESFHAVVDRCVDGLIVTDTGGTILFVNRVAQRFLSSPTDELVGTLFPAAVSEPDGDREIRIARIGGDHGIGEIRSIETEWDGKPAVLVSIRDVTRSRQWLDERERLILDLRDALARIRTLKGLIPICSVCKKIRDDDGLWEQIEKYVSDHSEAVFSHGLCPSCAARYRLPDESPPAGESR